MTLVVCSGKYLQHDVNVFGITPGASLNGVICIRLPRDGAAGLDMPNLADHGKCTANRKAHTKQNVECLPCGMLHDKYPLITGSVNLELAHESFTQLIYLCGNDY